MRLIKNFLKLSTSIEKLFRVRIYMLWSDLLRAHAARLGPGLAAAHLGHGVLHLAAAAALLQALVELQPAAQTQRAPRLGLWPAEGAAAAATRVQAGQGGRRLAACWVVLKSFCAPDLYL